MNINEYLAAANGLLYLVACVINGQTADRGRIEKMNLTQLCEVAKGHTLSVIAACALEQAGVKCPELSNSKAQRIRHNILLNSYREKVLSRFEEHEIRYMPLKGAVLQSFYPKPYMREMGDNDIYCDREKADEIKRIMTSLGFETEMFGESYHDVYIIPPYCEFEVHRDFANPQKHPKLYEYYHEVWQRLVKDSGNGFGYHFTDNDFYIYITLHEYKHFMGEGIGLRPLVDVRLFLKEKEGLLDFEYIQFELKKHGADEFELRRRLLVSGLFSGKPLNRDETEMLNYYILSGAYGNEYDRYKRDIYNTVGDKNTGGAKLKYVFRRVFPPMEKIKNYYPFFYRHKILIPALIVYRPFRTLSGQRRNNLKKELNELNKY